MDVCDERLSRSSPHAELPELIQTRWFEGVFPPGVERTATRVTDATMGPVTTERFLATDATGTFGVESATLETLADRVAAREHAAFTAALAESFENTLVRRMGAPRCEGSTRPLGTALPGARRVVIFQPPNSGRVVYLKTLATMEAVLQMFAIVAPGPEAMVAANVFFGHLKHKLGRPGATLRS